MKSDDIIRQFNENSEAHKTIMDKLEKFGESLEEVKISLAELPDKIFERADKRYASKVYEKAVYGFIGAIVLAVLYGLLELVIK